MRTPFTPRQLLQLLRDNALQGEALPTIRVDTSAQEPKLFLYDVIDPWYGVGADMVAKALAPLGDAKVHLHVNSPGGDVFEGRAIASVLVAYPGQVIAHIDGLAASAATTVVGAANETRITQGGMFMIHNGWTLAMGNRHELAKTMGLLTQVDGQIAADYMRRTGGTLEQMAAWMDAETWFTEEQALAAGFVDAIDSNTKRDPASQAQASASRWNLSAYANAPKLPPLQQLQADQDTAAAEALQLQAARNRLRAMACALSSI
jgi:ATP-dependent Clp protease, protease subunit